jgi:hypothetical protein
MAVDGRDLIVYGCPDDQRQAVLDVIQSERLSEDSQPTVDELVLGERYGIDETQLDRYAEIAGILMTRAPGATFVIWNDPKYEWLGGLMAYAPDLGAWSHDCDAEGTPVFSYQEVVDILKMDRDSGYIRQHIGEPWMERLAVKEPA